MRKLFSLFMALLATTTLWADSFQSGDLYYYITSSSQKTVEVTYRVLHESNYAGLTTITIPETVNYDGTTYSVTSIGWGAFCFCSSLTSITIPNSVTSIGEYAFYYCSALTSVTIGNSVTSIGEEAFYGCSSLTSITIPNSVTTVGGGMFYRCGKLESVVLSDNMISLPCYSEENYIYGFFQDCSSLTSITIPNSVTNIGGYAFSGCTSLNSVTIGNSVTSIGEETFYGCSSLTSITIPNSVTSIGEETFYGCSSLTSITIPNSVTSIGSSAFGGCKSLKSVTIPNSVTSIGSSAFGGCKSLKSVTIPNSVKSIGSYAFYGCSSLPVEDALRYADTYLVEAVNQRLSTYSIKEGTKWVGEEAFQYCSNLTSITIPNSVTSIGDRAFYNCSSLTSITIPHSVTSIGEYAFYNCSSLTSITILNSVTTIGSGAFSDCSSLTSITIPNSVTSIGDDAFYGCHINSIILSASDIATFCQGNANNLLRQQDIKCPRKLLIKDVETKEVDIPNSVESIRPYAFYNCIDLNKVSLSNSVKTIGNSAFAGCTGLNLLRLGTGIQNIYDNAFANCTKLYDIYCLAAEPPTGYTSSFANYNAFIHVPCESQRLYMLDVLFGEFKYIECIEAETTPTDTIVVTPSLNDAEFIWPTNSSADSYTLAISKDGEVFCTLTFNANGQLTGIAFAPSRNGQHNAPAAVQTANGFAFTVTGLDEGTEYSYELLIQDRSGNTLQSYSGEFRTQSTNDRTVTVEYDAAQGQVTGAGTYLVGDTVTLTATPNDGYRFVRWSNEVVDNPYTFVITENITLSAEFEKVIATSIEHTHSQSPMTDCQKVIRDGQLIILRDGKSYSVMGQEL